MLDLGLFIHESRAHESKMKVHTKWVESGISLKSPRTINCGFYNERNQQTGNELEYARVTRKGSASK